MAPADPTDGTASVGPVTRACEQGPMGHGARESHPDARTDDHLAGGPRTFGGDAGGIRGGCRPRPIGGWRPVTAASFVEAQASATVTTPPPER